MLHPVLIGVLAAVVLNVIVIVVRIVKRNNVKVYDHSEDGIVGIVIILAAFVFVIIVVLPFLQLHGNANIGCMFFPDLPSCK